MTRVMYDSVDVAQIPAGAALVAGYVDGHYANFPQVTARFPDAVLVPIAVFSTTNAGIVGDCENGDMTPQTAVSWVVMRRAAGVDPTIYCSEAAWAGVQQAFSDARVPEPHWWIAAYPGNGPILYPGSVAHQWIDHGFYDESVVADFWPGVDVDPQPIKRGRPNMVIIAGPNKAGQQVEWTWDGGPSCVHIVAGQTATNLGAVGVPPVSIDPATFALLTKIE